MQEIINNSTEKEVIDLEERKEVKEYIKYPIPLKIKIFGILILGILVFSLLNFPAMLRDGIAFERGIKAESQKKYVTALNEYNEILPKYPDSLPILSRILISAYKNDDEQKCYEVAELLCDREISNEKLFNELNSIIIQLDNSNDFTDELIEILSLEGSLSKKKQELEEYRTNNPNNNVVLAYLGTIYFDNKEYENALELYSEYFEATQNVYERLNIAAAYRQLGEFDKAINECNIVLNHNIESAHAYSSLARIEIKRGNYAKALQLAKKSQELDNNDLYVIDTLCIANHYNDNLSQRDLLLNILKENEYYDLQITQGIFDGTINIYEKAKEE